MNTIMNFIDQYLRLSSLPGITISDVLEIIILSWLFYHILLWIRDTKAWIPVRGGLVLIAFIALANLLKMNTIIWLVKQLTQVGLIGIVVIFQPELRRSLEELGRKGVIPLLTSDGRRKTGDDSFSDKTVNELVKACFEMGAHRTGALIVIEQQTPLGEYERTGIPVDALITSQLLLNIFEKNTPLHDGAVIVRGNRVAAATCYLPLSDNREISKALGTRHRAALGVSEVTDSLTLIVSEETGSVSVACLGSLQRNVTQEQLRLELQKLVVMPEENRNLMWNFKRKKGQQKDEGKADKS
jgi:diadenylate cyclase